MSDAYLKNVHKLDHNVLWLIGDFIVQNHLSLDFRQNTKLKLVFTTNQSATLLRFGILHYKKTASAKYIVFSMHIV